MEKVLCFGEILLRLSPDLNGEWIDRQSMPVFLGGAELNVATALAKWDVPVSYCTALPENTMTKQIKAFLEQQNIDISRIVPGGNRIGIYYLAQGTDLKHAEVIYDRAGSSTAQLQPGTVDWDEVLDGITWFHFSAISPAINSNLAEVCREALEAASSKNIKISVDLNYRAKLWKWGKQPYEVMPALVKYCNVVMGNIWAAEMMLGTRIDEGFTNTKQACVDQAAKTSKLIVEKFPACTQVANTFRFDRENKLEYYGTFYRDGELYVSQEHSVTGIADKVGSGDCFMAALIYGNINHLPAQETIELASIAAVDKMYVVGDATNSDMKTILGRLNR